MAIKWGSARMSGANGFRLGYEFVQTPSKVTASTTSVQVTRRLYMGTAYACYDNNNTIQYSGNFGSGTFSKTINHPGGAKWNSNNITLLRTDTITVNTSLTGTVSRSFSASMSGVEIAPGTASVSGTHTVAKRPVSRPASVSNVTVTRSHDRMHTIRWTNHATSAAPYASVDILRRDVTDGSFKLIANVKGAPTSYTDTTTAANTRYMWTIRPRNSAGAASTGTATSTPYIYTSPMPTTITDAQKLSDGSIQVRWSRLAYAAAHYQVERREDGVVVGTSTTEPNAWRFLHLNPSNLVTHSYRVRPVYNDPTVGTMYSAWSPLSNVVNLLAPPNPPKILSPKGVADATVLGRITWAHNPRDTTEQTAYELRWRVQGETEWTTTGKVSQNSQYWDWLDTFHNGNAYEIEVRTWGQYADPSDWSDTHLQRFSSAPTVTAQPPEDGILTGSTLTLPWIYFDAEGTSQTMFRASVSRVDPGDGLRTPIHSAEINGSAQSYTFPVVLQDGETYAYAVSVRDGDGMWSEQDEGEFLVQYPPAPVPQLAGEMDSDEGYAVLQVENPIPVEGEVDTDYNNVYRLIDGNWHLVAGAIPPNGSFIDYLPYLGPKAMNIYVVEAVSTLGASRISSPLFISSEVPGCEEWIWVTGGDGWSMKARVRGNPEVDPKIQRSKTLRNFVGRKSPLEYASEWVDYTISVSGTLENLRYNTERDWQRMAELSAPLCFRDMWGRRVFCSIGDVSTPQNRHGFLELSFTVTRVHTGALDGPDGPPVSLPGRLAEPSEDGLDRLKGGLLMQQYSEDPGLWSAEEGVGLMVNTQDGLGFYLEGALDG